MLCFWSHLLTLMQCSRGGAGEFNSHHQRLGRVSDPVTAGVGEGVTGIGVKEPQLSSVNVQEGTAFIANLLWTYGIPCPGGFPNKV